jgi:hypothetical protein
MAMRLPVLAVLLLLGGCTSLRVLYQSDPSGATLYENGQPKGLTPFTLVYQPSQAFKNGGCMELDPLEVRWASGATATTDGSLTACKSAGSRQRYMFIRPNVPGRDIDVNTALELKRNKILQEQNALIYQQMVTPQRPVNCKTIHVYGVANTTCY